VAPEEKDEDLNLEGKVGKGKSHWRGSLPLVLNERCGRSGTRGMGPNVAEWMGGTYPKACKEEHATGWAARGKGKKERTPYQGEGLASSKEKVSCGRSFGGAQGFGFD